jgi:hypothetical protein
MMRSKGVTMSNIHRCYENISFMTIKFICIGRTWRHVDIKNKTSPPEENSQIDGLQDPTGVIS